MDQYQSKHQDKPLLIAVDEHKIEYHTPFQAVQLLNSIEAKLKLCRFALMNTRTPNEEVERFCFDQNT